MPGVRCKGCSPSILSSPALPELLIDGQLGLIHRPFLPGVLTTNERRVFASAKVPSSD